jgi:hypothetical protein
MPDSDAQKKELEQAEEPLQDLTPEKDATGGVRVFDGRTGANLSGSASLDAQKKEIDEV